MYEINSGLSLILLTGDIMHFCSSKCRKNYDLGRDKKKLKWARQSTNLIEEEEENNKK
jgi:ribosomal protein L24E